MNEVIDEIVNELSKRIPSGIIDLTNESQQQELLNIMNEFIGDQDIINQWFSNLTGNVGI
jgi:hypothetical protein